MEAQDLYYYAQDLVHQGKAYHEIEKKLKTKCLKDEIASEVMLEIDMYIAQYEAAKMKKGNLLAYFFFSVIILIAGLFITIYSYFYAANSFYIAYGAILVGAWYSLQGYKNYARPVEDFIEEKRIFKKGRFKRF